MIRADDVIVSCSMKLLNISLHFSKNKCQANDKKVANRANDANEENSSS